jgi:hypothetical protein
MNTTRRGGRPQISRIMVMVTSNRRRWNYCSVAALMSVVDEHPTVSASSLLHVDRREGDGLTSGNGWLLRSGESSSLCAVHRIPASIT